MIWPHYTLDELGYVGRGRSKHRPRNDPSLYGGDYPFIQTADIQAARMKIKGYSQTYSDAGLAQSKLWEEPTLCMTIAGENTGSTAILTFPACFPDSIVGFIPDPKKADIRFVKHALDLMRRQFRSVSKGATQDNLPIHKILSFPLQVPPLAVQATIASTLAAYDDLIENNLQRISLLEEAARMLYREWFVHFRFPGHEHVKIIDGIPEGWSRVKLEHVLEALESGGRPKGGASDVHDVPSIGAENVRGIGQYDYAKEKYVPEEYYSKMRRGIIQNRDVVLYKDGAYIGRSSIFGDGFPHGRCAVNEHVFILRSLPCVGQSFLYFWLSQPESRQSVVNLNANTAQPGVSQDKLNGLFFLAPPEMLTRLFNESVEASVSQIFRLALMNQKLGEARDILLPRLMNGQMAV